jgi:hypothetical protein
LQIHTTEAAAKSGELGPDPEPRLRPHGFIENGANFGFSAAAILRRSYPEGAVGFGWKIAHGQDWHDVDDYTMTA